MSVRHLQLTRQSALRESTSEQIHFDAWFYIKVIHILVRNILLHDFI